METTGSCFGHAWAHHTPCSSCLHCCSSCDNACGASGATTLSIGAAAQLIAVGLTSGEVALFRLWSGSVGSKADRFSADGTSREAPLRVISMAEWGYGAEATGSVADLKWAPDSRALAVSDREKALGLQSCHSPCLMSTTSEAPTCLGFHHTRVQSMPNDLTQPLTPTEVDS